MLIHSNIQFFTFLAFRNFFTPFSFNLDCKLLQLVGILMLVLVIIGTFSSYAVYYSEYGKLAKYFLCNMFRFKSSYVLMMITYGVRPFLKGITHSILYEKWEIQMWTLIGIEALILISLLVFEFKFDNHRSKPVFMMDAIYSGSFLILNLLLLFKY